LIVKTILESISIFLIALGVLISFGKSLYEKFILKNLIPFQIEFRINFGSWLLVSLEFLLAADIVSSVISPTYENLIQLSIVAVLRIFLNYFLEKEVSEEIVQTKEYSEKD
ncbi:MAG: DUF1622 domain-containing protein, partial [Ignavibacteria bacterium]|nr:DUF1622 domain-containing protein [Ignavibacteria bacterium]